MKNIFYTILLTGILAISLQAQGRFPGISAAQAKELATAKKSLVFPLPTWVPAGFKVESIQADVGRKVKLENKVFTVVYSRDVAGGKVQRFAIDAGFDGIGDLMFDATKAIGSPVGKISLVYQPKDEDGTIAKTYAMTEWFTVNKTAFHYDGTANFDENDATLSMISMADTVKILKSLARYQ